MMRRVMVLLIPIALLAVACGYDGATTTSAPAATTAPATTGAPSTTAAAGPAMASAEVVFEAQSSDGGSIVVVSVTLPSPGFIAVHGDGGGPPDR